HFDGRVARDADRAPIVMPAHRRLESPGIDVVLPEYSAAGRELDHKVGGRVGWRLAVRNHAQILEQLLEGYGFGVGVHLLPHDEAQSAKPQQERHELALEKELGA